MVACLLDPAQSSEARQSLKGNLSPALHAERPQPARSKGDAHMLLIPGQAADICTGLLLQEQGCGEQGCRVSGSDARPVI